MFVTRPSDPVDHPLVTLVEERSGKVYLVCVLLLVVIERSRKTCLISVCAVARRCIGYRKELEDLLSLCAVAGRCTG